VDRISLFYGRMVSGPASILDSPVNFDGGAPFGERKTCPKNLCWRFGGSAIKREVHKKRWKIRSTSNLDTGEVQLTYVLVSTFGYDDGIGAN
jgi:hypothetical protein